MSPIIEIQAAVYVALASVLRCSNVQAGSRDTIGGKHIAWVYICAPSSFGTIVMTRSSYADAIERRTHEMINEC